MRVLNLPYRAFRSVWFKLYNTFTNYYAHFLMKVNHVKIGEGFISKGVPEILVHTSGILQIADGLKLNNTLKSNPIGRSHKCIIRVNEKAHLTIGENVGMSGTTIVCHKEIKIGDNVKIGGNTCIYDTDFHSLDASDRSDRDKDIANTQTKSIVIGNNVFIGAHVTILKGVIIGDNSIVGACSVVTQDIPADEIWAGNPARLIRKINDH